MSRVAKKAKAYFSKVAKLRAAKGEAGVAARQELKRMRDVYYDTDAYHPSAGAAWQPSGAKHARGSEGKARNIQRGFTARKQQGMNIGRA